MIQMHLQFLESRPALRESRSVQRESRSMGRISREGGKYTFEQYCRPIPPFGE